MPEGHASRIAVTEDGFICDCFDDEGLSSGKRYTYRCQGRKLTAGKITGDETAPAPENTDAPLGLPIPEGCTARAFGELPDGTILLALNTGASGLLCAVTADGTLHHLADMGQQVEWVSGVGSYGVFYTIDREAGAYRLCSWIIPENE